MSNLYSKEIDDKVKAQVNAEFKPFDSNKDYLDADPLIHNQEYTVLSFCNADKKLVQQVETYCFSYFLAEYVERKELANHLLNESIDSEVVYNDLIARYVEYKKENAVALRNRLSEYFGKEPRAEAIVKPRGTYKNLTKAKAAQKSLAALDRMPTYIAKTGYWYPTNPDKLLHAEHFDSAERRMNELMKGYKEEQEKASKAFGLRKDLLERQGKKIAEELYQKNLEDIKNGKFDNEDPVMPNIINKDPTKLTIIDEWTKETEKTYGDNTLEIELPIASESEINPKIKQKTNKVITL